jgi:glycosyltransferase involved in cell wall biosynthesis
MNPRSVTAVVIPVLDGERFIGESLESVLAQTAPPAEIVVVDDGSTDATPSIVRRYPSVHYIRQDQSGPGAARNRGIAATTSPLVAFHDADDLMVPERLERQALHLQEHPGTAAVIGRQEILLEAGTAPPAWLMPDVIRGDLGGYNLIAMTVRREALDAVGGFDPSYPFAGDRDLLVRLRGAGFGIDFTEDVVLLRRIHEANLTDRPRSGGHATIRSLRAHIERSRADRDR